MTQLADLKAAESLSDVANLLSFKPRALAYVLYKQPQAQKYKTFQIPKRGGGQRTINAPIQALKLVQRRLADLLQNCLDEINRTSGRKDRAAHGFKRRRSIITNAGQHRHRRYVFNVDLEDFFPSINFGRVRGYFIRNRDFELNQDVATVIAKIACYQNALPQGSPCSPVISNLIANILDVRLVRLAAEAGCTFSRYADDLTFSTNKKVLPPELALQSDGGDGDSHSWIPGVALRAEIEGAGFRINENKTHLMYRASRQRVTGLVVNEKINVTWEYRHRTRAMVHRLVTSGSFEVLGAIEKDGQTALERRPGRTNELHGRLGFIDSIDVYNRLHTSDEPPDRMSATEGVYRDFLLYTLFYAAPAPVIICEGETDNVYLTHAIRSLAVEFPDLADATSAPKIKLKVRLFKYPRSSTSRLLSLNDGGSGPLSRLIGNYKKATAHFTGPGLKHPVLVLYDNDEGAKSIRSVIKSVSHVSVDSAEPFVHVTKNLYAVPTPLVIGSQSEIEDFFEASVKATKVDGKTFSSSKNYDPEQQYGKKIFAHRVVRQKADKIDFNGFRPLLANLVAAIRSHKT